MLSLNTLTFVKSANSKENFLKDLPQVCFLGKSNVGKSSLINALANNKKLVYVSSTPGRTKLINYFNCQNKGYVVDAPGYGYFKDGALDFEEMMLDYLSLGPKIIKRVYLLLDSRRKVSEDDFAIINLLNKHDLKVSLVFTKVDKLNTQEKRELLENNKKMFPKAFIYLTSSSKKLGLDEVRRDVSNAINERE